MVRSSKSISWLTIWLLLTGTCAFSQDKPLDGARDKLHTAQGAVHEGRVMRVDDAGVWFDMGGAQSKFSRSDVARVEIPIPPEAQEGLRLFNGRDFSGAIAKLEPILARYDGLPQEWIEEAGYILAKSHLGAGNYAKAREIFERTEKFFPDGPNVAASVAGKARAHLGLGEHDKAIELLEPMVAEKEKLLPLSDGDLIELGSAWLTLGKCYQAQDHPQKALQAFLRVTALYPIDSADTSEALYHSGLAFETMNNLQRAVGQYKDFLEAGAGSPLAGDAKSRLQRLEAKLPKEQGKSS